MRADSTQARAAAAAARMDALLAKLSLGFTYCTMAEASLLDGHLERARVLLQRTQHIGEHVRRHLNYPNYVPELTLTELRDKVGQLERRVLPLAMKLRRITPL